MSRAPGAIDFARAWREWLEDAADPRLDLATDLAYWERVAEECDTWAQPVERTLKVVERLVFQGESLLEVGAGTGRFAIPLARKCAAVTALDQSPAVLAVLARKARDAGLPHIATVAGTWEGAVVAQHDVVLAAWSLYRQLDLEACLRKLVETAGRLLIIVVPDADASQEARGGTAAYLYVLGALRDLGCRAELVIVEEPRPAHGDTVPVPIITWTRPPTCTEVEE
ncbi:MAG: class I SAM-dependent methyltransferase [Dehalococcoidia bacterium]|nr:class I SAM-dependent methyltransferase [Dehalococcoidia bacterium]